MKKTALFFGSFNPIHIGHIALANYIAEYDGMDDACFIISPQNPLKADRKLIDDNLRLKWVRQAIEGYDKFKASDIEFFMEKPSYTYQTLTKLKEMEPDTEFFITIGADNLDIFKKWKNSDWIIENFKLLVCPRLGSSNAIPEEWSHRMRMINAPILEISSTFVRESIAQGKDVRFFLPNGIYDEVRETLLSM